MRPRASAASLVREVESWRGMGRGLHCELWKLLRETPGLHDVTALLFTLGPGARVGPSQGEAYTYRTVPLYCGRALFRVSEVCVPHFSEEGLV